MSTRWFSLRRQLLRLLLGGVSIAWLLTISFSFYDARHEVDELFDAQLANTAQTLLALSSHELEEGHLSGQLDEIDEEGHKYQRRLRFQIRDTEGQLLLRSSLSPPDLSTATKGFSTSTDEEGEWHHYSQWNDTGSLHVQVSEHHHLRSDLVSGITFRLIFPALFGLPLIGLWVWLATRRGLGALDEVAQQIASRDPQQLSMIAPVSAPEELRPMVDALNALFLRVETTLEAERRFTADAAHELRTPLAALQAQLQVAQRARNDAEREHSLTQLEDGLSRATHLIEQMLQLARLEPEAGLPSPSAVNLAEQAESVCAELGNSIFAKQLDFELDADKHCCVHGQSEWLRVLIRNLIDNAIRYTPAHGRIRVRVRLRSNDEGVEFSVCDSGPGIPAAERAAAQRRFHRLQHGDQGGSGLGLSIVARIAELHGTKLHLEENSTGTGLYASIRLPAQN